MLDKTYDPKNFEEKIYAEWEAAGDFKPNMNKNKEAFAVVIPPPNVTGVLHMGHALDDTLQDILIRYNRMLGKNVLWQPGMDHAGIATQMVVERNLAAEGITRHDLGREKFIETVWQWKEKSGGTICKQLRRLGASCDWSRARFTMDEGLSRAVRKIFVRLYKDGLIYKAKKLVNWDSKFMTAVSDLEVVQKETVGKMYYYKYPIKGEEGEFVHIATTRPETMFGDTAVAVSKDNEKLKHLIGKECIIPIINRAIPIVADDHADPEKGTGAVKITPAHDFNDFEVGKRHNLPLINILNPDATLNENTPFAGMDTQSARKATIAKLEELGFMEKIEDHPMVIPYGDRSNVVIEPMLTDQWFVDAPTLAKEAIRAVEDGEMQFVPKSYEKTYFEWMRNIQPWCISRQLWWGHQMPIWYGPDGEIFCEENEEEAHSFNFFGNQFRQIVGKPFFQNRNHGFPYRFLQHPVIKLFRNRLPGNSAQKGIGVESRLFGTAAEIVLFKHPGKTADDFFGNIRRRRLLPTSGSGLFPLIGFRGGNCRRQNRFFRRSVFFFGRIFFGPNRGSFFFRPADNNSGQRKTVRPGGGKLFRGGKVPVCTGKILRRFFVRNSCFAGFRYQASGNGRRDLRLCRRRRLFADDHRRLQFKHLFFRFLTAQSFVRSAFLEDFTDGGQNFGH